MNVTATELKARCGEMIERAASGEEIVITKRGVVKARMVAADYFDARKQGEVLANMAQLRKQLGKNGKKYSHWQIKAAIENGRR